MSPACGRWPSKGAIDRVRTVSPACGRWPSKGAIDRVRTVSPACVWKVVI